MRITMSVAVALLTAGCCCDPCGPRRRACLPVVRAVPAPTPKNAAIAAAERHGRGSPAVWSFLSTSYDTNHDGRVTADEYTRDERTFERLDRDKDGALTSADFDGPTVMEEYITEFVWRRLTRLEDDTRGDEGLEGPGEPLPLERSLLAKSFARGDANKDGRLTEVELTDLLRKAQAAPTKAMPDLPVGVRPYPYMLTVQDGDGSGDLSLSELRTWTVRATERAAKEAEEAAKRAAAGPPGGAQPPPAPRPRAAKVGEAAPAFTLPTREGGSEVSLASFEGKKPVALIFGSYTCPPFRFTAIRLREVVDTYLGDVQFLFVYIREAHAVDGRAPMPSADQPLVEEPITAEERASVATSCALDLGFDRFPTLVDGLDNAVARAYAAPPARLYVVGLDGKVVYQSGPGPFGLDPDGFEAGIKKALGR